MSLIDINRLNFESLGQIAEDTNFKLHRCRKVAESSTGAEAEQATLQAKVAEIVLSATADARERLNEEFLDARVDALHQ